MLLAIFNDFAQRSLSYVAVIDCYALNLTISRFHELGKILDILIKVNFLKMQLLEIIPVHIYKLSDKI